MLQAICDSDLFALANPPQFQLQRVVSDLADRRLLDRRNEFADRVFPHVDLKFAILYRLGVFLLKFT